MFIQRVGVFISIYSSITTLGEVSSFIMLVSLVSENGELDCSRVLNPNVYKEPVVSKSITPCQSAPKQPSSKPNRNVLDSLFGTIISECFFGNDLDGNKGAFFIFPELCLRVEGRYRLKFSLHDLSS